MASMNKISLALIAGVCVASLLYVSLTAIGGDRPETTVGVVGEPRVYPSARPVATAAEPSGAAPGAFEVVPTGLKEADFARRGYRQWLESSIRDLLKQGSPMLEARHRPLVVAILLRYRDKLDAWLCQHAEVKRRGTDALLIECPVMPDAALAGLQADCLGELDDLLGADAAGRVWDSVTEAGADIFNLGTFPVSILIERQADHAGMVDTRESRRATILGLPVTAWSEGSWRLESSPYAYSTPLLAPVSAP